MDQQQEYKQELEKVQDRDFTHDWVSSSAFLFYLSMVCLIVFIIGTTIRLWGERYEKPDIVPQGSTLYTPVYK